MITIQEISNISTIISPFVVVISLLYLARQFKQSSDNMKLESLNTAINIHVNQIANLTVTEEAAELFRKFCKDFNSLSLNERGVMHCKMLERIATYHQVWQFAQKALLNEDDFNAMRGQFISILRTPGGRTWWNGYKHIVPRALNKRISTDLENQNIRNKTIIEEQPWLFKK
jgi:hypothetical protein